MNNSTIALRKAVRLNLDAVRFPTFDGSRLRHVIRRMGRDADLQYKRLIVHGVNGSTRGANSHFGQFAVSVMMVCYAPMHEPARAGGALGARSRAS